MSEVLAHIVRGAEVESIHRGDLVVVDRNNRIVYSVGEPNIKTYWRSAAKPFQVVPMIEEGGIEKFGFDDEEIAVMAGSHNGEEKHVQRVNSIFKKMNCEIDVLDCGVAAPAYRPEATRILKSGGTFEQVHNPCSGKHSSMIAFALLKGYDIENYIKTSHPVQQRMVDVVSDVTGLNREDIGIGVDGCGVPVFSLPIFNMAVAYSKLALPRDVKTSIRRSALLKVGEVMTTHPYYIAGSRKFDTLLMKVTGGRLVAKIGAEGVYCVGVKGEGTGIALKIEDGSLRAIDVIITELLVELGLINNSEYNMIKKGYRNKIRNHRGDVIGSIEAAF